MLTADYVIVGAGLTGTALAVRLSEDPTLTVTVLEAGGNKFHDENIDTPANIVNNLGNPDKDWVFFSTPQKHLRGRVMYLPRGKGIGGSSLLNFMEVNRASSIEYNDLGRLAGESSGWSWKDLLPYFQKSETLVYSKEASNKYGMSFDEQYQGSSGPVQRTLPRWLDPIAFPWIEAVKSLGIPITAMTEERGLAQRQLTVTQFKVSSASAYYEPNKSRPNLNFITDAHAARITTHKNTHKKDVVIARGVEFIKDGILQEIQANKEVILCCGSYQTPQILELSGIDNPEILKKYGIPVTVNLPGVGNNLEVSNLLLSIAVERIHLQEHITATFTAKLTAGHETWENMRDPSFAEKQKEI